MSCYGCRKKYGLFTKEVGCPNCGFSYCVKCLKCTAAVPRHGGEVLKICLICYDKLNRAQKVEKVIDVEALPGTILNKDVKSGPISFKESAQAALASLENAPPTELQVIPVLLPFSKAQTNDDSTEINNNLDIEISKRLKNLKETLPNATDEIRERLANLTGMPTKDYSKKELLLSTDKRTDEEKMKDMLEEFLGEAEINKRVEIERNNSIEDIERRLMALRDMPVNTLNINTTNADANTPSDNEDNEETLVKEIMQKYLAEANLPVSSAISDNAKNSETVELPWCNICNEDAVYRCIGCDGELFCMQCFREVHDDEEYLAHVKENYAAPPKFKENHF